MPISSTCPHCQKTTSVADQYSGQTGPCPACGKPITIPTLKAVPNVVIAERRWSTPTIVGIGLATSIALLLVCGGVLLALVLPVRSPAREAARRQQCVNNLRQIGIAMNAYEQQFGCFPPAFIPDESGKPLHSWRVLLLPYLDCNHLYEQYRFEEPWDSPHNTALASQMPSVFRCPTATADPNSTQTSYAMIVGPHAISDGPTSRKIVDIKDGLSSTIVVAEAVGSGINWLEPRDLNTEEMICLICQLSDSSRFPFPKKEISTFFKNDISTCHEDAAQVLFGDSSVRSLSMATASETLAALMTIDGNDDTR